MSTTSDRLKKFTDKIVRRLDKMGDSAENWNWHDNAEFWRTLANAVAGGQFTRTCQVGSGAEFDYIDGAALIDYMESYWEGQY